MEYIVWPTFVVVVVVVVIVAAIVVFVFSLFVMNVW